MQFTKVNQKNNSAQSSMEEEGKILSLEKRLYILRLRQEALGKRSVNSCRTVVLSWFSPLHLKEMQVFNNNSTTPDKTRIKHNLHPQAL